MDFDFAKNKKSLTFYDILGCSQTASIEQINTEFKVRALQCHPDKNVDQVCEKFKELVEAKETLNTRREKYDAWINAGMCMPWPDWLRFTDKNQIVFHWRVSKTDPMITSDGELTKSKPQRKSSSDDLREFRGQGEHDEILMKFRQNII